MSLELQHWPTLDLEDVALSGLPCKTLNTKPMEMLSLKMVVKMGSDQMC